MHRPLLCIPKWIWGWLNWVDGWIFMVTPFLMKLNIDSEKYAKQQTVINFFLVSTKTFLFALSIGVTAKSSRSIVSEHFIQEHI